MKCCNGQDTYNNCCNIFLENFRVIRVEVIPPEKPLDANTSSKNNPDVDFTICKRLKYLCVDMASYNIQKYFMLIQDYQSKPKIIVPDKTHAVFSHCLRSISLSPFRNISLSLSVFSAYVSPGLIPHKKCMMLYYDYHCLIDNKRLRMHELFHLSL